MLGCTDMVVITTTDVLQSNGHACWWMPQANGLPQRCCCMQHLSSTSPAALTSVSMVAGAYRLLLLSVKVVVETLPEGSRET